MLLSVCTAESSSTKCLYLGDHWRPAHRLFFSNFSCFLDGSSSFDALNTIYKLTTTVPKFISVAWTSLLNSRCLSPLDIHAWSKRYLKMNMSRTILLSPLQLFHPNTSQLSNRQLVFLMLRSKTSVTPDRCHSLTCHMQSILLVLPLKYTQNPTTSPHFHQRHSLCKPPLPLPGFPN